MSISFCTVPECGMRVRSKNSPYCEAHYGRIRRGSKLGLVPLETNCRYCGQPVKRGSFYCSESCTARFYRGVTKGKIFKPEPILLNAAVREWRIVPRFPDYEISNDGRLRRATDHTNKKAGLLIRCRVSRNGYPIYNLTGDDGRITVNAHRIVAWVFLPAPSHGETMVLHADDNKLNCCDGNLRWGTGKDNSADAKRNGRLALGDKHPCAAKPWTRPRGESHARAKLTEQDVRQIMMDDRTQKDIAAFYSVDPALIGRIKQGKVWKHITNPAYSKMLRDGASK